MQLKNRILAALVVVALMYGGLWMDAAHGTSWGLMALMAVVFALGGHEFYSMTRARGAKPFAFFGCVLCVALVPVLELWCRQQYHGEFGQTPDLLWGILAAALLGSFFLQGLRRTPEGTVLNVGATMLGILYLWGLGGFVLRMRHLGLCHGWEYDGIEFVLLCFCVSKCSDVGGLMVGSSLGKHKLIPWLSPKKTWEGAIGGVCVSMLVLTVMMLAAPDAALMSLGWARVLGLGAILGVCALLGDLIESAVKRDCEVKDAGSTVPGFGGILDLVDSLFLCGPVMYGYLLLCGAQPGMTP